MTKIQFLLKLHWIESVYSWKAREYFGIVYYTFVLYMLGFVLEEYKKVLTNNYVKMLKLW